MYEQTKMMTTDQNIEVKPCMNEIDKIRPFHMHVANPDHYVDEYLENI